MWYLDMSIEMYGGDMSIEMCGGDVSIEMCHCNICIEITLAISTLTCSSRLLEYHREGGRFGVFTSFYYSPWNSIEAWPSRSWVSIHNLSFVLSELWSSDFFLSRALWWECCEMRKCHDDSVVRESLCCDVIFWYEYRDVWWWYEYRDYTSNQHLYPWWTVGM